MGFSGTLIAKNLINADNGDMNGWAFSLDSLGIEIQANQLKEAGFKGDIIIPIADEQKPFTYTAMINPGNEYIFNVATVDDIQFDVFQTTQVEIFSASYLEIKVSNGKFRPKANLHGKMTIGASLGNKESSKKVSLANIAFENLQLQSVKPYLKVGAFSFGSEALEQKMAEFPVGINNIGLRSIGDTQLGLDFDLRVNLTDAIGGEAGLTIVGNLSDSEGHQKWKYDKIQVNDISVEIDQGAFKFYGRLQFFRDDAIYGNGFNGVLDATFNPGIQVAATAIFGSVKGHRFWYADALATFPVAIPVAPPLGINGFGGGAYRGMKMDNKGIGSDFGRTASGVVYVPDVKAGLGLKATVAYSTMASASVINGDATFEIAFYKGGGVRSITFTGNMYAMTPPIGGDMAARMEEKTGKMVEAIKEYESQMPEGVLPDDNNTIEQIHGDIGENAGKRGSMSAHTKIVLDFENRSLHATMEMYLNVAGGLIKGVGSGGRAGWSVIHYDPNDWYFYLGTPDDRIGISAGVGPIRASLTAYFMVGTKIPGSPPPPEIVSEILGGIDLDYMKDENALGLGKGFGFGAALSVDTGDLSFLMFYARFQAGMGFDIMLKNYGDNVRCKGRSDIMGINGWYANGQMYAYFDGDIGIRVKVFGKKKSFSILQIGAAAVLQAKLPNPFWMRGIVGGRFSVLGGLVKGDCRFEVTLGEECEIISGSVLDGIEVISDVTPQDEEKDIDVFNTPQAVFNMPIDKVFELVDVDDVKKSFRIKLNHFNLVSDGRQINGELQWNDGKDVVAFNSFDVMPSQKKINLSVKVSFEEKKNGVWEQVVVDGKEYFEEWNRTFTSGVVPDYIPHSNVVYSYPVIDQYNFYPQEYDKGYITLGKGQPYLFDVGNEWKQIGRFKTADGGDKLEFDFVYNSSAKQVDFSLPSGMKNNKIYAFELINTPTQAAGKVDRNVRKKTNKVLIAGNENLDTEVTTKSAEGTIDQLQEKSVFATYMRSSQFATFSQKIDNQPVFATYRGLLIPWSIHSLKSYITTSEYFDAAEINGVNSTGSAPLVSLEAVLSDNAYYNDYVYPLVYEGYPLDGDIKITYRDVSELGVIPVRAITINQSKEDRILADSDIQAGSIIDNTNTLDYRYNLAYYYANDFYEIQNKVVQRYINQSYYSDRVSNIIWSQYPVVQRGNYKVRLKYTLPGKTNANSTKIITLKYGE